MTRGRASGAAPDYSPKSIGRLVDEAIGLFRADFRAIALPGLYFLMPLALAISLLQSQVTGLMARTVTQANGGAGFTDPGTIFVAFGLTYSVLIAATGVVSLGVLYYNSCLLRSAPALLAHEPVAPGAFLKGGWKRFGHLALAMTIVGFLGGIPLVGLVVFVYGALVMPVTVLEEAPLGEAVSRSLLLVGQEFWRTVGFYLAALAIIYALESAFTSLSVLPLLLQGFGQTTASPLPSLPWQVFIGVMQGAAYVIGVPMQGLCLLVLYLDLRSRREGMDLTMRAQRLTPTVS
jgi:hypothetical protein